VGTTHFRTEHHIQECLNLHVIFDLKSLCFCRYLLQKRADPLIRDAEQNIALHWSAFSGSVDVSEMLLEYGCDVNCTNVHGDTPL
jgi:ankyrin repeat protein